MLTNARIFIDTSAIMLPQWSITWESSVINLVRLSQFPAIVPLNVVNELQKHESKTDIEKMNKARAALTWLNRHKDQGITLVADEEDKKVYMDQLLVSRFAQMSSYRSLIAIIQDEGLARDLLLIDKMTSFSKKPITICRINQKAKLGVWKLNPNDPFDKLAVDNKQISASLEKFSGEKITLNISHSLAYALVKTKIIKSFQVL